MFAICWEQVLPSSESDDTRKREQVRDQGRMREDEKANIE